jgi:hypothetical protein
VLTHQFTDALHDGLKRFAIVNVDITNPLLRFGRGGVVVIVEVGMMRLLNVVGSGSGK